MNKSCLYVSMSVCWLIKAMFIKLKLNKRKHLRYSVVQMTENVKYISHYKNSTFLCNTNWSLTSHTQENTRTSLCLYIFCLSQFVFGPQHCSPWLGGSGIWLLLTLFLFSSLRKWSNTSTEVCSTEERRGKPCSDSQCLMFVVPHRVSLFLSLSSYFNERRASR